MLPRAGLDPIRDVQVLCPMYRGAVGVHAINEQLAERLNPAAPGRAEFEIATPDGGRVLRLGDRVIQTRNDYTVGVFNGETGIVVNAGEDGVHVDFGTPKDPYVLAYNATQARALYRAYALTTHKSQGSQWPCVVIPVHTSHAHMWSRQLLYTAVTRAQRWCVLLGTERALALAIRRDQGADRWTALSEMLRGE